VIAPSRGAAYRRFYLYSALSVTVIAIAVGGTVLLRLALQSSGFGLRPSADEASRSISLAVALLAVALPVGGVHLWLIVRSLADPAERAAEIRHQYLNLWVASALLAVLFAGQAAFAALIQQDAPDATVQASVLVVAAVVGAIGGSGTACEIWTQNPPAQPNRFTTLVVTLPTPGVIHLQGTATAGQDGSIDQVSTQLLPCQVPVDQRTTTAPANCDYGLSFFPGSFTSHAVSPGIPVTSGQQVLVKVDISFS